VCLKRPCALGGLAGAAMFVVAGCQTYEPKPLDFETHRQAWLERSPASEDVRVFAERLREHAAKPAQFDPSDGLTLAEAEIVALVFNPDLRQARARAKVAAVTAAHAGLWEDPVFEIDVLRITESVSDPWVITPGLALTIPLSGRVDVEHQRADAAWRTERVRIAEREWALRRDVRKAWASWSAARLRLEQTRQLIEDLQPLVKSTRKLAEVGELLRTESALFAIERAQRRNTLHRLRSDVDEREQELRGLLGLAPDAPLELIPSLPRPLLKIKNSGTAVSAVRLSCTGETPVPPFLEIAPGDSGDQDAVDALEKHNLTLARLRQAYQVAEHALHREVRKQYPDFTIGPLYESDEGQSRIGFLGAIPLPILNANQQGIAEARAERSAARAAFEAQYERLMNNVAVVESQLDSLRTQHKEINEVLIPMVDRQVDDARQLLEIGEGGVLVLLESLIRAQEIKMQLIDLRMHTSHAEAELTHLLGPTSKQQSLTGYNDSEIKP